MHARRAMRGGLAGVLLLWGLSCQRENPLYCDDLRYFCEAGQRCDTSAHRCVAISPQCTSSATCADQAPICDSGMAQCRACQAGEDDLCAQHDPALPRCLGPACVECLPAPGASYLEASDCSGRTTTQGAPAPVCDAASHACRPCTRHAECASGVCAKDNTSLAYGLPQGSCVPAAQVLVVDPETPCSDLGTGNVYCTPAAAIGHMDMGHRYLVLRRSARPSDFSEITLGGDANAGLELFLIGPMADAPPSAQTVWPPVEIGATNVPGVVVTANTHLTVEGLFIHGGLLGIKCWGDGPTSDTQVRVVRSLIADNGVGLSIHDDCHLIVEASWVGHGPQGPFSQVNGNDQSIDITRADFDVINTVISENGDPRLPNSFGGIHITGGLGDKGRISTIVNSTFFGHEAALIINGMSYTTLACDMGANIGNRLVVANSLFFQDPKVPPFDHYITPACGGQLFELGSDEQALVSDHGIYVPRGQPPGFKDLAARDFHLGAQAATTRLATGGVAHVKDAMGKALVDAPTVDMDGRPRPLGTGHVSLGAYEAQ